MRPVVPGAVARRFALVAALALVPVLVTAGAGAAAPARKSASAAKKPAAAKKPVATTRWYGAFALEFARDQNIIHYSEADLVEFETGPPAGKFDITTAGDWIIRPRVDLAIESRALTGRPLETLLRVSSWRYVENGIKNNESFMLRFKHPGLGRDNVQLAFYYSPEAYLRNFRDRPPYAPLSQPSVFTHFTYRSTSASLAYARTISTRWDGRAEIRRSLRRYNREFMENDADEWRAAAGAGIRIARPLKLSGEYSYTASTSFASDQAGEVRSRSNDGDGSFERDGYRLTLDFYFKKRLGPLAHLAVDGQYQAFYYTSSRTLVDDPTHVGRKDRVYQLQLDWDTRPVIGPVTLQGGFRYNQRDSSAPGSAIGAESIDDEKDYTDRRGWFGFEVPF